MGAVRSVLALAACSMVASCATAPTASDAPPPGTQALLVRTDPPGASCSILQNGTVVASVDATPGIANVPVVFCRFCLAGRPEEHPPIEVACSKEGYLASRMTFAVQWAHTVLQEAPPRDPTPAEVAGAAGGAAAWGALQALGSAGLGVAAVAPIALPVAAVGLVVAAAANKDRPPRYTFAYRPLPEFLLTPAAFASESDCDAHFTSLKARLVTARDAQRANIDAHCRFFPCKASDPAPCPDPVCERQRTLANEQLKSQLDQIPALRTQVRIAGP
jgi:hypothetical protein